MNDSDNPNKYAVAVIYTHYGFKFAYDALLNNFRKRCGNDREFPIVKQIAEHNSSAPKYMITFPKEWEI